MKTTRTLLLAACSAAGALGFGAAYGQQKAGSTATYWMSAETTSGMGAMGAGGGGMAAAMMGGRGPGYAHNLTLQLGSGRWPLPSTYRPPASRQEQVSRW
jgi:hypothetical protein